MRVLKRNVMRPIAIIIIVAIIFGGLSVRLILKAWPDLWGWMLAYPTETNIIIGVLTLITTIIFGALSVFIGMWYGRYQYLQWEEEHRNKIAQQVQQREKFPFTPTSPQELPAKLRNRPEAMDLPYLLSPAQEEMINFLNKKRRLLIRGRRGLGKTREAIELVRRLERERGDKVTVLIPHPFMDTPLEWPMNVPTGGLLLFLNDLHERYAENLKVEWFVERDFHQRLKEVINYFESYRRDFWVIATVRDDPIELWERIHPKDAFWNTFYVYQLPNWDEEKRGELIEAVTSWLGMDIEDNAKQFIAQTSDGTPASIITFFVKQKDKGLNRISFAEAKEFTGTYPNEWEGVWEKDIAPVPAAKHLFAALSILSQAGVPPYKYLVVELGARLWGKRFGRWWKGQIRQAVKSLGTWVKEEEGKLKCPEAYLEGKGDLQANAQVLTDLLLSLSRKKEYITNLIPSLSNLARTLKRLGEFKEALKVYSRLIELAPQDPIIYNDRGNIYVDLGEYELAIQDFDQAIDLNHKYDEAYNNRGNVYANLGKHKRAIEDFNEAIKITSNYAEAYNNRGTSYEALGEYERAIENYSRALKIKPENTIAYNNRGLAYYTLGKYEQAIQDFKRTLAIDPQQAQARFNLGLALLCIGKGEIAIAEFKKGIERAEEKDLVVAIESLKGLILEKPHLDMAKSILEMLQEAIKARK
jgi:tetratricopeptide (TPR) repeat protein